MKTARHKTKIVLESIHQDRGVLYDYVPPWSFWKLSRTIFVSRVGEPGSKKMAPVIHRPCAEWRRVIHGTPHSAWGCHQVAEWNVFSEFQISQAKEGSWQAQAYEWWVGLLESMLWARPRESQLPGIRKELQPNSGRWDLSVSKGSGEICLPHHPDGLTEKSPSQGKFSLFPAASPALATLCRMREIHRRDPCTGRTFAVYVTYTSCTLWLCSLKTQHNLCTMQRNMTTTLGMILDVGIWETHILWLSLMSTATKPNQTLSRGCVGGQVIQELGSELPALGFWLCHCWPQTNCFASFYLHFAISKTKITLELITPHSYWEDCTIQCG